jgi:DNA repair exonuclease SbcCD ATPase subunit
MHFESRWKLTSECRWLHPVQTGASSHKHTTVTFGKHINFITGVNGSGKSAVLIAITVVLGGKASFARAGLTFRV